MHKAIPQSWRFTPQRILRAAELRDIVKPKKEYERSTSIIEPWLCKPCNEWTPKGSAKAGKCLRCHTPRPRIV